MISVILHNYILPSKMDRETQLRILPEELVYTLALIHLQVFGGENDNIMEILQTPEHPLDAYVYALMTNSPQDVAAAIGAVVPIGQDTYHYLVDNLPSYSPIIERPNNQPLTPTILVRTQAPTEESFDEENDYSDEIEDILYSYSDEELFGGLGAYVGYGSRAELISKLAQLSNNRGLFIPLNNYSKMAYGTLANYDLYEQSEIISLLQDDGTLVIDHEQIEAKSLLKTLIGFSIWEPLFNRILLEQPENRDLCTLFVQIPYLEKVSFLELLYCLVDLQSPSTRTTILEEIRVLVDSIDLRFLQSLPSFNGSDLSGERGMFFDIISSPQQYPEDILEYTASGYLELFYGE